MENAGADFIVLPCNTLHVLAPQIRKFSNLKFLDLIEVVSKEINSKYKKIAILCTTKTRKEKLYDRLLKDVKIIYSTESEQAEVSKIILRIIRGDKSKEDRNYLSKLVTNFKKQGAEKTLLACTDLANLIKNKDTIDTSGLLVESIIKEMGN